MSIALINPYDESETFIKKTIRLKVESTDSEEDEDVSDDDLSPTEVKDLVATLFGENSDIYNFVVLLIQIGVIK